MSYTTLNRLCEPRHIYAPPKADRFVSGMWYPDYGPNGYEFSEQHNMHPTNTIFRNAFTIPKERQDLAAKGIEAGEVSPQRSTPRGRPDQELPQQFRHNLTTEALYKSTIIQPYKSGGRASTGKERHNYQWGATLTAPTLEKEHQSFTSTMARSLSSPAAAGTMPTSLVRLRDGSLGASFRAAGGAPVPEWVATSTMGTRPFDAAGHGGSTRNKFCRTTPETGTAVESLAMGSATISTAAKVARNSRSQRWASLTRPQP